MRIAVTGTHSTGKTTLIDDFVAANRQFQKVDEPYWELIQDGRIFSALPSIDEFEAQLEHSVAAILQSGRAENVIFDRCPLDLIAYLEVLSARDGGDWMPSGKRLQKIEAALSTLNLIVFLPIETPDRTGRSADLPELRRTVDERLDLIMRQDVLGLLELVPDLLELTGSPQDRLRSLAKTLMP